MDDMNFRAKNRVFLKSRIQENLNFRAKNHDFSLKVENENQFIFGTKKQIHNFDIFLKIEFLDWIWDFLTVCIEQNKKRSQDAFHIFCSGKNKPDILKDKSFEIKNKKQENFGNPSSNKYF